MTELQGRRGEQFFFPRHPQQQRVLLDLSAIAAGKNKENTKGKEHFCSREVALI